MQHFLVSYVGTLGEAEKPGKGQAKILNHIFWHVSLKSQSKAFNGRRRQCCTICSEHISKKGVIHKPRGQLRGGGLGKWPIYNISISKNVQEVGRGLEYPKSWPPGLWMTPKPIRKWKIQKPDSTMIKNPALIKNLKYSIRRNFSWTNTFKKILHCP